MMFLRKLMIDITGFMYLLYLFNNKIFLTLKVKTKPSFQSTKMISFKGLNRVQIIPNNHKNSKLKYSLFVPVP